MNSTLNTIKKYIVISQAYVLLCIGIVPFIMSRCSFKANNIDNIDNISEQNTTDESPKVLPYAVGGENIEEYIKGVVAAEMPASFPIEALKAQAVASRTYAIRAIDNADKDLQPSDIGQAYITKEKMRENWGDNYDYCYNRVCDAVNSTAGEIMEYDGEPILAVFHSTSAGITETAGNIWNYDLPYLESADSPGDTYAPNFESIKVIKEDEIISLIKEKYSDFDCKKDKLFDSIKILSRSDAGYITEINIGGKSFTGKQVREMLGLRSTNFTVAKNENGIAFTTKGFGHGAGMSQYGAKYMAEQGTDYKGILQHYYKNIVIQKK